ncbi:MAG: dTDP-4-dehydrorhamnose 3,5-epimerase [Gemmatimonadaceae bacterium]
MKVHETGIDGVLVVESPVYRDGRGFFTEVHHSEKFAVIGLPTEFVQDNHSRSGQNVLRGMHFQRVRPQGKLIRPVSGTIFDVAVDMRQSSSTFGHWFGTTLEAGDGKQLWIAPGMAHGFLVLSEFADVSYKCTTLYDAASDGVMAWNDPAVGIDWPLPAGVAPILSGKDASAPLFSSVEAFA